MLILGIESSCDETAASVVEDGRRVLSDTVSSQVALHARYGGIVPEVASRQHLLQIVPVIEGALSEAEVSLDDISAVAVTYGPGLAGALMVGVNAAKALAFARGLPLVGVHHLEGHTYAAWLEFDDPATDPGFPLIVLIASGAHTDLILMRGHGDYELLGRTRDDASGEAFDKAARILGLGFPGGPVVQRAAEGVTPGLQAATRMAERLAGLQFLRFEDGAAAQGAGVGRLPSAGGGPGPEGCRGTGSGVPGLGGGRHLRESRRGSAPARREGTRPWRRRLRERPAATGVQGAGGRTRAHPRASPLHGQRGDDRRRGLLQAYQGDIARTRPRRRTEPCPGMKD